MYFIDLSMRNPALGYVDSVALIADVVGAPGLTDLLAEAEDIAAIDSYYSLESLDDILREAEDIAFHYGYHAFAYECTQYVMTVEEYDEFWNEES